MRVLKKIWNNQNLCGYGGLGVVLLGIFGASLITLGFIFLILIGITFILRGVWFTERSKNV